MWQNFEQNDDRLITPLSGEWAKDESGKLKPSRSYKLHVEWASWSQAKRTALRNELDAAQEEAKDAGKKKLRKGLRFSSSESKVPMTMRTSTLPTTG